jgi:GNAT superfamily N-acetyltransferase
MPDAIDVRAMQARDSDLLAFKSCFENNGGSRELDALRWQYIDNPTGQLLVDLATSGGQVAAIYAVQPTFARVDGQRCLAAQSVDTLVDSGFRGRGLFTELASTVYQRVQGQGGAFVYGFPNANSVHGFFDKLGWSSLDPVPFLVRPLRTRFLASKLPTGRLLTRFPDLRLPIRSPRLRRGQTLRSVTDLGPGYDALWQAFSADIQVSVDRSAAYMSWRLAKPGEAYIRLGVFEREQLTAFCAYKVVEKHGGRIGYVLELLHEPGDDATGIALLRAALRAMASDGADAVLGWSFRHSPNYEAYAEAGFLPLPERLRPIELHFGVRPLNESLGPMLRDRSHWYISYCDSDTV